MMDSEEIRARFVRTIMMVGTPGHVPVRYDILEKEDVAHLLGIDKTDGEVEVAVLNADPHCMDFNLVDEECLYGYLRVCFKGTHIDTWVRQLPIVAVSGIDRTEIMGLLYLLEKWVQNSPELREISETWEALRLLRGTRE